MRCSSPFKKRRNRTSRWLFIAALGAVSIGSVRAQEMTKLEYRWSPIVDLHFYARAIEADPKAERPEQLRPLLDAIGRVNAVLGKDAMSWGVLEGNLFGCRTAADIEKVFAELPEKYTPRRREVAKDKPPSEIELRALALDLAAALKQVEPYYVAELVLEHERIVQSSMKFMTGIGGKESEFLGFVILHLGGKDPGAAIPVYLVTTMMFPRAVTLRRPADAGGVCFVAVRGLVPLQLFETVLHEAIHTMDERWGDDSTLGQLRAKLAVALPAGSPLLHDIPHTLMFVHSGETVRRIVNPEHRHYGDVSRYYSKVPEATKAVRGPWIEYLDGKLSREQVLDKIVEAAKLAKP